MMRREADEPQAFDPTVDIFVGLACVIFLVILLILPAAQIQSQQKRALQDVTRQLQQPLQLTVAGAPTLQILAKNKSVTFVSARRSSAFSQDDLFDNPDLNDVLRRGQTSGAHPVLFIDPSGQEAAFLLETRLAQFGYQEISKVFLDQHCGFLQDGVGGKGCGAL